MPRATVLGECMRRNMRPIGLVVVASVCKEVKVPLLISEDVLVVGASNLSQWVPESMCSEENSTHRVLAVVEPRLVKDGAVRRKVDEGPSPRAAKSNSNMLVRGRVILARRIGDQDAAVAQGDERRVCECSSSAPAA